MSATPIPRTMMLSFFGDMDVSILNEKPAGIKGDFILSVFLTSSMGVSYQLKPGI